MFHQSIKVRVNNFVQIYNYSYNASTFLLQHNKSTGFFLWSAQLAKLVFPLICHTFRLSRCHMHMFLHLHSKQILFTSQSAGTLACLVQLTL